MAEREERLDVRLGVGRVAAVVDEAVPGVQVADGFAVLETAEGRAQVVVGRHGRTVTPPPSGRPRAPADVGIPSMRRDVFTEEHELFRQQVRRFVDKEVAPRVEHWNARGTSDRETWKRAGDEGLLGVCAPAEYGGA